MSTLTIAATMALAAQCAPGLDPTMLTGIALHESRLDPAAIHVNAPGRGTDYGLMQINDRNFALLGLTVASALDPCVSMRAAAAMIRLFSRYNTGTPTGGITNGYAQAVVGAVGTVRSAQATAAPAAAKPLPLPSLHLHDQIASFR